MTLLIRSKKPSGFKRSIEKSFRSREFTPQTIAGSSPAAKDFAAANFCKSSSKRSSTKAVIPKEAQRQSILAKTSWSRMRAISKTASAPHL